jgi:hypothetical protein
MCTLHGRRWRSKISQERLTRGTVCGTMRSMCGADAGCSATNYQSRCTLHGVHKQRQGRKRLHLRKRETISRAHPKGRVSGTSAPRMRLAMSRLSFRLTAIDRWSSRCYPTHLRLVCCVGRNAKHTAQVGGRLDSYLAIF